MTIVPIKALRDNYIWCLIEQDNCIIVDPGEAQPVEDFLTDQGLALKAILVTHHHYDHTDGIAALIANHPVPVYGSTQVPSVNHPIKDDDHIDIASLDIDFKVMAIPAHTLEHVAYYHSGFVFTGDTLFTGGCGRIFEGTAEQMYLSLARIASLPVDTQIYCGHEYTLKNLEFAQVVEPENVAILQRLNVTKQLRSENQPTVPAPLSDELKTNPFLRCTVPAVVAAASYHAGHWLDDPIQVLATLRKWKNAF